MIKIVMRDENLNLESRCSGVLINNERGDGRPLILTAFHCLDEDDSNTVEQDEQDAMANWLFVFNYQSDVCAQPAAPGPLESEFMVAGATFIDGDCGKADWALLELSEPIPGDFNAYYAGWRRANEKPSSGVCISHPLGDIKKIATYKEA